MGREIDRKGKNGDVDVSSGGCFPLVTDLLTELHPDGHGERELSLASLCAAGVLGACVLCLPVRLPEQERWMTDLRRGARLVQLVHCRESLPGQSHARFGTLGTDMPGAGAASSPIPPIPC